MPVYAQTAAGQVEEVVVTAQRRETNIQDTPISVAALSGPALERMGVTDTNSLTVATPALAFNRQAIFGAQIYLRGVGSITANAGQESPVAVYVDDVYIGMPDPVQFTFNNIAGVEVLKGPQGTLFGRNATGGVIHVHTREPTQDATAEITLGYGNYDTWDGAFYGSTGITEDLAANLAVVAHRQNEGYGRDLATGADTQLGESFGARSNALWTPSDDTRVRFSADYSIDRSDFGGNVALYPGAIGAGGTAFGGHWNTFSNPADERHTYQYGLSAKLDQALPGDLKLVSISAWRKARSPAQLDQDAGVAPLVNVGIDSRYESWSEELHLVSPESSRLRWLLGAYYFHLIGSQDPQRVSGRAVAPLTFSDTFGQQTVDSASVFGEATYALWPATNLTLGARYTNDKYKVRTSRTTSAGFSAGSDLSDSESFPKLTYRAILDHHFTPDVMGYVSHSRGFKSGGWTLAGIYSASPPTAPTFVLAEPVKPEVLDAFEGGIKSELLDHRLRLNASAFYYDYKNLQVTSITGIGVAITTNAAAAIIKGAELQLDFVATDRLSIEAGLAALRGRYTAFPNAPISVPNPAVCSPTPMTTGPLTGGNRQCTGDLRGNKTVRTPPLTANLTANYRLPTPVGEFSFSGTAYYNEGFYWEADNRLHQPAYTLLNGSIRWTAPSGQWDVTLWGRNLTDKIYYLTVIEATLRDGGVAAAPRTFGATFGLRF